MTNLPSLIMTLFWSSIMFLGYSALVYFATRLAGKCWSNVPQWRGLWLIAVLTCWLPLVLFILPVAPLSEAIVVLPTLVESGAHSASGMGLVNEVSHSIPVYALLVWLWVIALAIGVIVKVLVLGNQVQHIRHQVHRAVPVGAYLGFTRRQQRFLARVQQRTKLEIRITEDAVSPYVFGLWRPCLVLTADVIRQLSLPSLQLIVRHEWTHVQRRDYAWVLWLQLSVCFAWFNPFYRAIIDRVFWATELSCDVRVLHKKPRQNRRYAKAMIDVLALISQRQQRPFTAFAHHQKRNVRMRISTILLPKSKHQISIAQRSIALCSVFALTTLAVLTQPNQLVAAETANVEFQNPVPRARLSSSFGQKPDRFHNGIDLAISLGTKIAASAQGRVLVSTDVYGDKVNYGKIIILEHANGLQSLYSHLDSRRVSVGDKVAAGEIIGTVGETGKVTGPHLHFEILDGGTRLDPGQFIGLTETKKISRLNLPAVM